MLLLLWSQMTGATECSPNVPTRAHRVMGIFYTCLYRDQVRSRNVVVCCCCGLQIPMWHVCHDRTFREHSTRSAPWVGELGHSDKKKSLPGATSWDSKEWDNGRVNFTKPNNFETAFRFRPLLNSNFLPGTSQIGESAFHFPICTKWKSALFFFFSTAKSGAGHHTQTTKQCRVTTSDERQPSPR